MPFDFINGNYRFAEIVSWNAVGHRPGPFGRLPCGRGGVSFWVRPKRRTATPSQGYVVWILFQWRHYVTTLKRNTFSLGYAVLVVPFYLVIQSYWIVKILVISHT